MNVYRLPEELRSELKTPLGPVRSGPDAVARAREHDLVVTVGDVVTRTLLEAGTVPHLMVVDHKTKREATEDPLEALPADRVRPHTVPVENPAATITEALWDAIATALSDEGPTVVRVTGEEDLATLPAVLLAPEDAVVLYGQPDEGVVLVEVTNDVRSRVRELIDQMET